MMISQRAIALSGRGSRFGPSEYGGTQNSQNFLELKNMDSSNQRSDRGDELDVDNNSDTLS